MSIIEVSVGILYSAQGLIQYVSENQLAVNEFINKFPSFPLFECNTPETVLALSQQVGWVEIDKNGILQNTDLANEILDSDNEISRLRHQLFDVIRFFRPPWSANIPYGRQETLTFLPAHILQCFKEAGLSQESDDDVVSWWDLLASISRGKHIDDNVILGRKGERLSIEFETKRTGLVPKWIAIETNREGYDLLSVHSDSDSTPLCIEVKATGSPVLSATFHLSRNEYYHALEKEDSYVVHLWEIRSNPRLVVVPSDALISHVPKDRGDGKWESVEMPFKIFDGLGSRNPI